MILTKGGDDFDVAVYLGDFGIHSEGVTGKTTSDLTVYAVRMDATPTVTTVASGNITMAQPDSTNLPGWYTLTFDVSAEGWVAGEVWELFFKCAETTPSFAAPPSIRVAFTTDDPTGSPWDELKSSHTTADSFGDYLDVKVSSRASQTSLDTHDFDIKADIAAVQAEVDLPIFVLTWSQVPFAYPGTDTVFSVQVWNAKSNAVIAAADLDAGSFKLSKAAQGSSAWRLIVNDPAVLKDDGAIYYNQDPGSTGVGGGYAGVAGDTFRWTFDTIRARVGGVWYTLGPAADRCFQYGKLLSESGTGSGGGGATPEEIWAHILSSYANPNQAGGMVRWTYDLSSKIKRVVVKIASFLGVQTGVK